VPARAAVGVRVAWRRDGDRQDIAGARLSARGAGPRHYSATKQAFVRGCLQLSSNASIIP